MTAPIRSMPENWINRKCWDCAYAIAYDGERKWCRRVPPTRLARHPGAAWSQSGYPDVTVTSACAEFEGPQVQVAPEGFNLKPGAINKVRR